MADEVVGGDGFLVRPMDRAVSTLVVDLGAIVASSPPGSAGGGFAVDPEHAEACIQKLRRVEDDLSGALAAAWRARVIDPPGDDLVSGNVAVQARIMAERAFEYARTWQAQVHAAADALEQQLRAYQRVDRDNAGRV